VNHRTSNEGNGKHRGRRMSRRAAHRGAAFRQELQRHLQVESLEARVLLATYDGALSNVGAGLRGLSDAYQAHITAGGEPTQFTSTLAEHYWLQDGALYTTVRATNDINDLLGMLQSAGFEITASSAESRIIEGFLPLGSVEKVAQATGVASVLPVMMVDPTDGQGSVNNQAQRVLSAGYAAALFDADGTGVTVGVISDSVNRVDGGLAASVATGDLPAGVSVLLDGPAGSDDEGRAMLELIYDIAPGATLKFASGVGGDAQMGAAIDMLVAAGADIIVDDLNGLTTEPFFQDGIAAQAVTDAVAAGVTYISSAGNRGTSGYEAPLNLKAFSDPFPAIPDIDVGIYHDFDGMGDVTQTITLLPGETTIVFQYDDPLGAVTSDMDIWLINQDGTAVLDAGRETSILLGVPREFLTYDNTTGAPITAQLLIQKFDGTDPARFKWIGINNPTIQEHLSVADSLSNPHNPGHGGTEDAISVAASAWRSPTTPEPYTSHGPVTRTLDADGHRIPLAVIEKPLVTAVDRTSTSVVGFSTFAGTSAAAANAAAVAALLQSFDAALTPAQVRETLLNSATDIAAAGFDRVTGAGLINAMDAMLLLTNGVLPLVGDRDADLNDTFTLIVDGVNDSLLDVTLDGVFLGSVPLADLTLITVDAGLGSDTLIVDESNGLVTVPIQYDGGGGASDGLIHAGAPGMALTGQYTTLPDGPDGHAGVLAYNGGQVSITFTGLEPVQDLVPALSLTINDAVGADIVNFVDGPLSSAVDPVTGSKETTYEVNFGGLAESIQFRNKNVVTVNSQAGNDVITVNVGPRTTADALAQILLNGDAGTDTMSVIQSRIGTLATGITFNGGSDSDVVAITPSTGGDHARVTDAFVVNGGSGANNTLSVDDALNTAAVTWTVTGAALARTAFGGVSYASMASVTLLAQNTVGATVNVESTSTATTVNTGGGQDTINVSPGTGLLASIAGPLTLTAGAGADHLVLWDNSNSDAATYSITATGVLGPNSGAIGYDGTIEFLTLEAGTKADTIQVAPSLDTGYTIHGRDPAFFASPGDHLIVDLAGPGTGTLLVTGPGDGTITCAGGYEPVDYTSIEVVDAVDGALDVQIGGDGADNEIRLALDPSGANLQLSVDGVLLLSADKNAVNTLAIDGMAGADTLVIDGENGLPTLAGALTGSYDNPNLAGAPSLLFEGAAGADRIVFEELDAGFDQTYAIGDGVGGGSGASTSEGEILTAIGPDALQLYFVGLEPALTTSAGGDTLTVIGDPNANTFEIVPSPLIAGGTRIQETAGPYESFDFAAGAFANLRVFGHDGMDALDLIGLGTADDALTLVIMDGRQATLADDDAVDTLRVRNNTRGGDGAGVAVQLFGGGGDDVFSLYDADPDVDGLLGSVSVDGNAGDNHLTVKDTASAGASETVIITATTIAGITGPGGIGGLITYTNLNGGQLVISANDAGHTFNVRATAAGLAETELNTGAGNDTINVYDPGTGTANGVVSPIDLNTQGGDDALNITDSADGIPNRLHMNATEIGDGGFGAAVTAGGVFGAHGILLYDGDLEAIDVQMGHGQNELNIDATGVGGAAPTAQVTITDGAERSVFNIQSDQLAAVADHTFNGDAGPDIFNVYLAAGAEVTGHSVQINGQAANGDSSHRDSVRVWDDGGVRSIAVTYQSASSGNVVIEIDAGTPLDVRTTEEVLLAGDAANDDVVTVYGTVGDDDLTIAPLSESEALVFLDGNPWDGPLDADPFEAAFPGIAGGGAGPDLLIQGLKLTGLTVEGNGAVAGDQLYVYAPSEQSLFDAGTPISPFGQFGLGVIIPGFTAGKAYDEVSVADWIVAVNNTVAGTFVHVNIDTHSFVQIADDTVPGLIVNTGSEAAPNPLTGIADDIVAVQSFDIAIRVNGGDPVPSFAPDGDRLSLVTAGDINVYSDKSVPPVVTTTTSDPHSGATTKELSWSSIERITLTPGMTSQTVNLIGDNNDPAIDQNDTFVVVGADVDSSLVSMAWLASNPAFNPTGAVIDPRFEIDKDGANEFYLTINGSTPIGFRNVVFLNVYGDDQNPAPGAPSAGPDDIDTLDITPYADAAPAGWGIDVRFDEGNPVQNDGEQADLLIYHTASHAGVSEDIVVQPSMPEGGELRVTGGTSGAPIVTISYANNLDLVVLDDDGDVSDTDSLLLKGTSADNAGASGNETVVADFSADGDVTHPLVVVSDTNAVNPSQPILYRVRDLVGFDTVTIDTMGGDDSVSVIGRTDGSLLVNVIDSETIVLPGHAGGSDYFELLPGAREQAGVAHIERARTTGPTTVTYVGTTLVNIDNGGGGTAGDEISVVGTGVANHLAVIGVDPIYGYVSVDAYPAVGFTNLGTDSRIVLSGLAGDDLFSVAPVANWKIGSVFIDGGAPTTGSDQVEILGTAALDQVAYYPSSDNAGNVQVTTGSAFTYCDLWDIEHLTINGVAGNDTFTIATYTDADTVEVTPGATHDAGDVQVDSRLPMSFTNLGAGGTVVVNGTGGSEQGDIRALVYNGTAATDSFLVGQATIWLDARVPVHTVGIESYTLRGLGGDDSFSVMSQQDIAILVEGDEPSGSDTLNYARDAAGNDQVNVWLDADLSGAPFVQTIEQVGYGVITHTGVERVNMDIEDGQLFVSGTRGDDVIEFTPLSEDSGVLTADHIPTEYLIDDVPAANPLVISGGGTGRGGPAGGGFADTVIYRGTNGSDLIQVNTPARTVRLAVLGFGYPPPVVASWRAVTLDAGTTTQGGISGTIEVLDVFGGNGNDTIQVAAAENVGDGLYVNVDGGAARASDALVITDFDATGSPIPLGADDFVVVGQSRIADAGDVLVYQGGARRPNIAYENVEVVSPNVAGGDNVLVLGPDMYEQNEYLQTAAYLGAGDAINVENLSIFPNAYEHLGVPADQDFYRVVAARTGILDFQVYFRTFDAAVFPAGGDLNIEVLDVAGNVIGGAGAFGNHDTTPNARVRIPAVAGQTYYLHVLGATSAEGAVVNGYDMTILNTALPVPYDLELVDLPVDPAYDTTQDPPADNSDTGRSHFDNVTADNSPGVLVRLDDGIFLHDLPGNGDDDTPPDEVIPLPFNPSLDPNSTDPGYRVAIYVEGAPLQTGITPQTVIGYAQPGPAEGIYMFDFDDAIVAGAVDLLDGSHFISAKVEVIDPSTTAERGYGGRSASLEVVIDTVVPPIALIDMVDDLECPFAPDDVTNDTTWSFYGYAEADSVVRIYIDLNDNGTLETAEDRLLGEAVAIPFDGNNQFPNGYYEFTSPIDLNDPSLGLPYDGLRTILATAEDLAGNVTPEAEAVVFANFLDTQGPQITSVVVTGSPLYDLFDPKPSSDGPTPLVYSLTINVRDLPNRVAPDFLYPALIESIAENAGHYRLVGDAGGVIPIQSITFTGAPIVDGHPAEGTIVLVFADPLPDDRYTLTVSDNLTDPICNQLDGESNAAEPQETPVFPTGDHRPGTDFVGRFTVDSRPEIAVWAAGNVWVDTNGNRLFDPANIDYTNRDIIYALGFTSDDVFAGNFVSSATGTADGFDKLAAYGRVGTTWRWLIDTDNDGVANDLNADGVVEQPDALAINGLPFAGNFDRVLHGAVASALNGDEVGAFTGTAWYFDTNHDFRLDTALATTMRGYPIVGDFNGDGVEDLGTWMDDTFSLDFGNAAQITAANPGGWNASTAAPDVMFRVGYIGPNEHPVCADMDADGIDDIGLWVPNRTGVTPAAGSEWYLFLSAGNDQWLDPPAAMTATRLRRVDGYLTLEYTPVPFGPDMYAQFGDEYALPVVGNFDPPVTSGGGAPAGNLHTNLIQPLDVNADGSITPLDALITINRLNTSGTQRLTGYATSQPYLDVNLDGFVSPRDALMVINYLNAKSGNAEGEGDGSPAGNSMQPDTADVWATTTPPAGEARFASALVSSGSGGSYLGWGPAEVQTAVADPQAVVAGYTVAVGYLPFAAHDLWSATVADEALHAYLDTVDESATFQPLAVDDLLAQAAVAVRDEAVSAVDQYFQRWRRG
jgi:hypothetical protein